VGDSLYSAFLNYQWREIVVPIIIAGLDRLAATIDDENERSDFEMLCFALIKDLYDEDFMDSNPVGIIAAFPSETPPSDKWLYCNGQRAYRSDYPDLWDIAPTLWQNVPPTTTPDNVKLPDMRNKFAYGATNNTDLGTSGGEAAHTLTVAELPVHDHTITHTHNMATATALGTTATRVADGGAVAGNTVPTLGTNTPNSGSAGSGTAHNNIPPYTMFAWMIKVLP
jgi:microcystin-dependent protein